MNSKFDQLYNTVLEENAVPVQQNPNLAKDVQDFFTKHGSNPQFFAELEKQINALQKTAQQKPSPTPAAPQQNTQAAQQQTTQQPAQQQSNPQQAQQQGQPNQQQAQQKK